MRSPEFRKLVIIFLIRWGDFSRRVRVFVYEGRELFVNGAVVS